MFDSVMRALGFGLCHQLPERSFFGGGHQLPVCARDTGIYLGFVLSVVLLQAIGRRRSEPPSLPVSLLGLGLIGVMAFDGITSYAGLRSTSNDLRLITGLAAGFGMSLFATPIANAQLWRRPVRERVLVGWREPVLWVLGLPAAYAIARWVLPLTGAAYPLIVAACIVLTFEWVNLAVVCLLPVFEGRADRLRDAWAASSVALALTAVEIAASSAFRLLLTRLLS